MWKDRRRTDLAALVVLALMSLAIIGVNPFRQTLAPVDLLLSSPGFHAVAIDQAVVNPERSDVLDHVLPNWRFFRAELHAGRIPLWNPLNQLGSLGIQHPIFEGISVPFLIFAITPDESIGYTLAITSNFLLAAFGCYFLLLFMFASRTAAIFGALVFAFSGFNVAWAHWPHLTTSAWIPWVLATELRYWQTGRGRWTLFFAISVAFLSLGGFPFVAVVGAIAALLLAAHLTAADLIRGHPVRPTIYKLLGLSLGGLGGVAIAAPALAQMVQFIQTNSLSYRPFGTILGLADLPHLIGADWGNRITVERTFFCGIVAAVFAIFGAVVSLARRDRYALFGILLSIFVLATAYGLAPNELVARIPAFGFNPWSRAGVLTGLVLAVLSAYFVHSLQRSKWPGKRHALTTILITAALGVQSFELFHQFSTYNSKPEKEAYFPHTASLDYVASRIAPFQSVLADAGFLVSGTVSNYGLPELFAHGFRTPGQRKLMSQIVSDPFTTPTASMFGCDRVDFSGRHAVLAAARYVFVATGCTGSLARTEGTGRQPSRLLNAGALSGTITVEKAIRPDAVAVRFTTHGDEPFLSDVRFEVFLGEKRLTSSVLPAAAIHDNQPSSFPLELSAPLVPGSYRYVITMLQPDSDSRLSVWTFASGGPYFIGTTPAQGTPRIVFTRTPSAEGLIVHRFEDTVIIGENPAVSGSAYFVRSLDQDAGIDFSQVQVNGYRPSDFRLRYDGAGSGFVVVPMRTDRNWAATVNGTPTSIAAFHEVFAAVPVSGPADIRLYFMTDDLVKHALAGWTSAAILLIGASLLSRRLAGLAVRGASSGEHRASASTSSR